jgi:iron(III) transport system ATP-binding protein
VTLLINALRTGETGQVGLEGYGLRLPSELSGGQQQRVAVARALVRKPSVLLFDEPLSNLDTRLRRRMREEIRELQQRLGLTVVYVAHDQQEAMAVSDRIIVMNAGRIEQQGTPRELYERPTTPFLVHFMGESTPVREACASPERWTSPCGPG